MGIKLAWERVTCPYCMKRLTFRGIDMKHARSKIAKHLEKCKEEHADSADGRERLGSDSSSGKATSS
jgi:hypothetical protein